ncbi:hypothetical protein D3C86_1159330 [compost metagenome]
MTAKKINFTYMKTFIQRFFLVVTPVLIIVSFVNYFGDAANIFKKDYEKNIANNILKGNNVTNIANHNERLLQKYLINNAPFCPDVLVLGASRSMLISSTYFKGETFFNNCVSGATIEDLIAIVEIYRQKKCLPKKIIIGVEPYFLNSNNNEKKWETLELEYQTFVNRMADDSLKKENNLIFKTQVFFKKAFVFKELFSPSYFKSSVLELVMSKNRAPFVTDKIANKMFTKLSDGSVNYDLGYREASNETVEEKVSSFLARDISKFENFDKLDISLQSKFISLIDYLLLNNVKVEFFVAPYHPRVYEFITHTAKYKNVIKSEAFFESLAVKKQIKIIGSSDPNKFNLDKTYFYDALHLKEKGVGEFFKSVEE